MILATLFTKNFRKEFKENFTIYCPLYSKCYGITKKIFFPISCKIIKNFFMSRLLATKSKALPEEELPEVHL